ncbi:MAG: hypothetical protein ACYDAM_02675 [Leptospirales bacterium]
MGKTKKTEERKPVQDKAIAISQEPNKTRERQIADLHHSPVFRAYAGGKYFNKHWIGGEMDSNDCMASLREGIAKVRDGNMSGVEATLVAQADTLDLIFNAFLRQAINDNISPQYETFMRLALKAQSQCRCTLETLAEIKNPKPTAFIKQQNMAVVQQVNNNISNDVRAHAGAGENNNRPNELSERREDVEVLDSGTAQAAIGNDPRMEALEEIDRTKDRGRKNEVIEKRGSGKD